MFKYYFNILKQIEKNYLHYVFIEFLSILFVLVEIMIFKNLWELKQMSFILLLIASLVAALIAGIIGYLWRGVIYRKALMSAPEKYVEHLDKLIKVAASEKKKSITVNVRDIVNTRDNLQESLTSLSKLLDFDIDRLKEQLESKKNKEGLHEIAQDLEKKWPAKKNQIRIEITKLISELGLKNIV